MFINKIFRSLRTPFEECLPIPTLVFPTPENLSKSPDPQEFLNIFEKELKLQSKENNKRFENLAMPRMILCSSLTGAKSGILLAHGLSGSKHYKEVKESHYKWCPHKYWMDHNDFGIDGIDGIDLKELKKLI